MASTHILCTGRIVDGEIELAIAMPPLVDDEPVDGELQRMIDEAEQTTEYEDYLADLDFFRTGC